MKNKVLGISLGIFALIIVMTGCDNRSISPLEESSGTFSIYGALSTNKNINYIRVKDLTVPFLSDSARNIDADVTFEDLQQGTSTTLEDTVVNLSGDFVHNFIVEQQLQPDGEYRLTVERSDGTTVTTKATAPGVANVVLSDNDVPCTTPMTTRFQNVIKPEYVRLEVGATYQGSVHWADVGKVAQVQYNSAGDEMVITMTPRNYLVEIFPPGQIDNPAIDPRVLSPTVACDELDNNTIMIRYIHYGPEWDLIRPERGPFDPTESPDVDNGLGFLGAYSRGNYSFTIDL